MDLTLIKNILSCILFNVKCHRQDNVKLIFYTPELKREGETFLHKNLFAVVGCYCKRCIYTVKVFGAKDYICKWLS